MDIRKTISEILELPREIVSNLPLISMTGAEILCVENFKGIIEFVDDRVRINTASGVLKIEGKRLLLKEVTSESLTITGAITKVEYLL